jgi:16S rRNA (cytosine967-C5)-methyltransferase
VSFEKPREIAMRLLLQREAGRDFIEHLLEAALAQSRMAAEDRGLLQELVYGAVRWQATLDWLIARKTDRRMQKPTLQILLRLALYQMFWLSRIPDYAAVNETVELARREGYSTQAGFVNAVLRGCLRERDVVERALAELKQNDPALGYSHPKWLCDRWTQRLGREDMSRLLEWNNTPPLTFARVNLLRTDADQLREQWAQEKVEAKLVTLDWAKGALIFEFQSYRALASLPSFTNGLFYIQDPSTLLAVTELDPQPGETILDLCAAPGGKTVFMAERMKNQGRILAHDTAPDRLKLVEENCARLGVTCVQTVLPSALNSEPSTTFDRILIDAPCSNTGVMRRRVDLRWRIRESEITRLRATQLQLLHEAMPRLKPGGVLVYSTCSLEPQENSELVKEFLSAHPAMHLQREHSLTPWQDGVDGAYVARLVKGS